LFIFLPPLHSKTGIFRRVPELSAMALSILKQQAEVNPVLSVKMPCFLETVGRNLRQIKRKLSIVSWCFTVHLNRSDVAAINALCDSPFIVIILSASDRIGAFEFASSNFQILYCAGLTSGLLSFS
jgi:hypothetical protein